MMATLAGQSPFASARFAAITQLAVFEAVNAITGEYRPYLGTISAPAGASAEAAAAAAAHGVLEADFPAKAAALLAGADSGWTCEDQWDCHRRSGRCGDGGAARGRRVGRRAVLPADFLGPRAVAVDAVLSSTRWNLVSLAERHAVRRPGRPSIPDQAKVAQFAAQLRAVGAVNSALRSADRADVARFYAIFSPVAWANSALQQVAGPLGESLTANARALALVNMAISDASVASFAAKYHYTFWRPETAIHEGDVDGNHKTSADPFYVPYIVAPCFPGYPSNHASLSGAAREVLESLYGADGHDITFSSFRRRQERAGPKPRG